MVPDHPDRIWFYTSQCPLKPDPKIKTSSYLIRWARKRDKDGKEVGGYLPAVVRNAGNEAISAIAVRCRSYSASVKDF